MPETINQLCWESQFLGLVKDSGFGVGYECCAFKVFVKKALNRLNDKSISRRSRLKKYTMTVTSISKTIYSSHFSAVVRLDLREE